MAAAAVVARRNRSINHELYLTIKRFRCCCCCCCSGAGTTCRRIPSRPAALVTVYRILLVYILRLLMFFMCFRRYGYFMSSCWCSVSMFSLLFLSQHWRVISIRSCSNGSFTKSAKRHCLLFRSNAYVLSGEHCADKVQDASVKRHRHSRHLRLRDL